MTTEEKFNAAVNVIKSLPKNGPYQPSYDLMLRFYAYYKQATLGPCRGARPAFWDVVGKAKYDAWKKLGDITSEAAMARYVDELHTIVETMSFSDNVASFLNAPNDAKMDNVMMADLELIAGDVFEKVRSQNNSPLGSRDQSPERMNGLSAGESESPYPSGSDTEHSDGEYVDTIESPEPRKLIPNGTTHHIPLTNGYVSKDQKPLRNRKSFPSVDISQEISSAVQSLRTDVEALGRKVTTLENARTANVVAPARRKLWWRDTPPQLLAFIFVWPIVATFIVNKLVNRRKL